MKYTLNKVILFIILFIFLISSPLVYSQGNVNLPSVSIQPNGMIYYPIKRLAEKIIEKLQFTSESKERYYENQVQTRLAELKYMVDKGQLDQIEKSTQRVSYQVGVLTEYVVKKKLNSKKQSLDNIFKEDKIILEKLRDKYPANSSFWMLVQHVINSIDINSERF